MWRGERQTIKLLREQVDPTAKYVWFHAASLGEFEQGRPLMERLRELHPEYKIRLRAMRCAKTIRVPTLYAICRSTQYATRDASCVLCVLLWHSSLSTSSGTTTSTFCSIVECQYIACRAYSVRIRYSSAGTASSMARCCIALLSSSYKTRRADSCCIVLASTRQRL